jgi:hypothetical protein
MEYTETPLDVSYKIINFPLLSQFVICNFNFFYGSDAIFKSNRCTFSCYFDSTQKEN